MIPLPDKKYSILSAAPPRASETRGTRAAASKHYGTMTVDQLKKMGVGAAGVLLTATAPSLCGRPSPCCAKPSR